MSSADSSDVSAQPCTATLPSRASRPTATFFGKLARRLLDESRIAHRRGADDDAVDALLQPALDGRHVADAAAELHALPDGFEDALDRGDVHRLAGKGAVEIDHVQMLETLHLERARLRRRIAVKDGGARHVALLQAHGEAFLEVDGGEEDHASRASSSFRGASEAREPGIHNPGAAEYGFRRSLRSAGMTEKNSITVSTAKNSR